MGEIDIFQWAISQGIGAVLAFGIFLLYRKDALDSQKRLAETAKAYMEFGERYATSLTHVAEALNNLNKIQEKIEYNFTRSTICPVSQLRQEDIRRIYENTEKSRKTIVEDILSSIDKRGNDN